MERTPILEIAAISPGEEPIPDRGLVADGQTVEVEELKDIVDLLENESVVAEILQLEVETGDAGGSPQCHFITPEITTVKVPAEELPIATYCRREVPHHPLRHPDCRYRCPEGLAR